MNILNFQNLLKIYFTHDYLDGSGVKLVYSGAKKVPLFGGTCSSLVNIVYYTNIRNGSSNKPFSVWRNEDPVAPSTTR